MAITDQIVEDILKEAQDLNRVPELKKMVKRMMTATGLTVEIEMNKQLREVRAEQINDLETTKTIRIPN